MRRYREEEGMLEDEQMFGRSRKALEIIDAMDSNIEILEALHDEFVPDSGIADTVGGEIVRAINRIVYRWNNDGDEIGWDYGVDTVNSSYEYLIENDFIVDKYDSYDFNGNYHSDFDSYEEFLDQLEKQVIDTLYNRPELFDEKNEDDSRSEYLYEVENETYGDDEDDDYDDGYYDEEEDEEEEE